MRTMTRQRFFALTVVCVLALGLAGYARQSKGTSLFNGKDLSGWHMDVPALDKDPNGTKPFIVRNGLLVSLGTPGGHLITDKSYHDYRVTAEYRFSAKPGNCGILVHASKLRRLYGMGIES